MPPIFLSATNCLTALGDARATHAALLQGRVALAPHPTLGPDGGDLVPLALCPGRPYTETTPPNWLPAARALLDAVPAGDWGSARRPIFVTSSNFGVGSLQAFRRNFDPRHLEHATPSVCVDWLTRTFGWGPHVTTYSHACVSAHLAILQATRALHAGLIDEALLFTFDFLSPFVVGGFNSLKILNADYPTPYQDRPTGSIGLGDGTGFVVLTRAKTDLCILGQSLYNEMHHFTANNPDASGFAACLAPLLPLARDRRLWLKGHGTGTLEAGRLEATVLEKHFPNAPLVGWKGSIGHTLGSCGIVELAIAAESLRAGRAPGTVGSRAPTFTPNVALTPIDTRATDAVLCTSNAFGGAHAALLLATT